MIDIRPVSDLRNNFAELEKAVQDGHPIFLTKNGYGTMVLMSVEHYSSMGNVIEMRLDEADDEAERSSVRLEHDEVFERVRNRIGRE